MHTLLNAIQQRYACREFASERPVLNEELALILQAGRLAPSAFGLEPWRFVVRSGTTETEAIAHACFDQPAVTTAPTLIAIVALVDALNPDSEYVRARFVAEARGEDTAPIYDAYRSLYHANTIAAWAQGQCHFAAAHMMLQAAHMGQGSCPIGGFDTDALTTALAIPSGEMPALLIALGHCAKDAPERLRKPPD
ncbi:MAG: NAD(P)H-dependent oxidoreductase [Thiobacillus sp.]